VDIQELLAGLELFQAVDEQTLREISRRVQQRVMRKGQKIYVQDQPSDHLFVLASGEVRFLHRGRSGNSAEVGRSVGSIAFGEEACLGVNRWWSAEVVEEATLLVIVHEDAKKLITSKSKDGIQIPPLLKLLARTVRALTDELQSEDLFKRAIMQPRQDN
jgi:CRP-like cAMP-binding protein